MQKQEEELQELCQNLKSVICKPTHRQRPAVMYVKNTATYNKSNTAAVLQAKL